MSKIRSSMPVKSEGRQVKADDKAIVHVPGVERVILTIDTSYSMNEEFQWKNGPNTSRLKAVIEAIHMIIDASSRAVTRIGLVKFNTRADLVAPITDRFTVVKMAAVELSADGSTNYNDGIKTALLQEPNRIILLSDGEAGDPNGARQLAHLCKQKKIKIDTVGIGDRGLELLKELAAITGGVYFFALNLDELRETFLKLETRARLQLEHRA